MVNSNIGHQQCWTNQPYLHNLNRTVCSRIAVVSLAA